MNLYFRRSLGSFDLALYMRGIGGGDDIRLSFSGKVRKARKIYDANCGHKIRVGSQYFDARSSALAGVAIRYCTRCLASAENTRWDFEDDLVEQEETLLTLSDDDWGGF